MLQLHHVRTLEQWGRSKRSTNFNSPSFCVSLFNDYRQKVIKNKTGWIIKIAISFFTWGMMFLCKLIIGSSRVLWQGAKSSISYKGILNLYTFGIYWRSSLLGLSESLKNSEVQSNCIGLEYLIWVVYPQSWM